MKNEDAIKLPEVRLRVALILRRADVVQKAMHKLLVDKAREWECDETLFYASFIDPDASDCIEFQLKNKGRPKEFKRWHRAVEFHHQRFVNGHHLEKAYEEERKVRDEGRIAIWRHR